MRERSPNAVFAALATLLLICGLCANAQQDGANRGTQTRVPQKYALLVGIDNYKYSDRISSLTGSLNDVEDIRAVLVGKFQFQPENILVLKDTQATHAAIINAIQAHLIAKAHAGDIVIFHYSGHGSQMKDVTGKMISGLDETIVPYDSRDPGNKVFDISGAELHPLLVQLASKTKNLTFILDSCHSGTLVRGARVRGIPADTRTPPPLPPGTLSGTRGVGATEGSPEPKFAFISAASSRESAFEYFAEGKSHGALTYFLTRQMRASSGGVTYRDIMDGVAGNVTANYPAQHPSLEGAEPDQHVLGDSMSLARDYVGASPSSLDVHHVTLDIGQLEGATVGSVYDVYLPGSKTFAPPEKAAGRVQVASVGTVTSDATLLSSGKILPASRAVEREHRYGSMRMRLFIEGLEESTTLQSIRSALRPVKYIEVVDDPTLCNMQLRQQGNKIETLAADSTTLSPPVAINDPTMVERVVGQLMSWAKWFNILSIRNAHSEIDLRFTLKDSRTRDPMARIGRADAGVTEGEMVDTTLTNYSERDVYVAVLDLSSDGSISVVYPSQQGAKEVLKPAAALMQSFKTFVPKGRSNVTDILKVFASYKPIDLTPLTQGQIRNIGDDSAELDPLQQLLMDSSGVSRGLTPVLNKPVELGSWTTIQRVLVVKRPH
jgi:uncharacterized caspase-like protein